MGSNPSLLRRLGLSLVLPVALTVIYATQTVLSGKESWSRALAEEAVFCSAWWLVGVLIFQLCAWLHREPRRRPLVAAGLLAGAAGVIFLEPTVLVACRLATAWAAARIAGGAFAPGPIAGTWRGVLVGLFGFNLLIYGGLVVAWYALAYYRDAQRQRVESAEMRALVQQAQLQALRNQLNPHFLFNTLHSIAELVHENPRLAEQMLLRLSELLRKALQSSGAQEVPLAEELDFARGYLEVEQLRLGDRLTVTWDIAPESLPVSVPSLLLQPLIENAIQHGIAPSPRPGTLAISARRDGDSLAVQVHDSGSGPADPGTDRRGGIGLANTGDRLRRLYGDRQQFVLHKDHGFRVEVRLPFRVTAPAADAA